MDFRGAGDPLIFFGPLRGAPGNQACTRRTPGAHQADTRKSAQNRGSARISPTEGAPLRVCRGVQLALVPWGAAGVAGRASLGLGRTAGRASLRLGRTAGRASLGLGRTASRAAGDGGVPVLSTGPGGGGWRSPGSPGGPGMAESRFSLPGRRPLGPFWGGPKSGVSGRRFGRARGDSRGSFRLEWLRIEFWRHPRSLFSKPTLELRRLAPARGGGIRWIFAVPGTP